MLGLKKSSFWTAYYGVLRVLNPFALVGLRLYSRVTKQARVRVLIVNQRDEVLLVKSAVGSRQWSLPGGGVGRHEDMAQAAIREIKEELQCTIQPGNLRHLYTAQPGVELPGLHYTAPLYVTTCLDTAIDITRYQKTEIQAVRWFHVDALPSECSSLVGVALKHLLNSSIVAKID